MDIRSHQLTPTRQVKPAGKPKPQNNGSAYGIRQEFSGRFPSLWQTGLSGGDFFHWSLQPGSPQWRFKNNKGVFNKCLRLYLKASRWIISIRPLFKVLIIMLFWIAYFYYWFYSRGASEHLFTHVMHKQFMPYWPQ